MYELEYELTPWNFDRWLFGEDEEGNYDDEETQ